MRRARGFTLVELVVVVCVVALLFGVALDRLERYQELAERTAVEQNIAAMNVALSMKFASLVVAGKGEAMRSAAGTNPVALLARPPENYLGELDAGAAAAAPKASWYFDARSGELVYVPARTRFLASSVAGPMDRLRYRIALTEPLEGASRPRELAQPYMQAVHPFRWTVEP